MDSLFVVPTSVGVSTVPSGTQFGALKLPKTPPEGGTTNRGAISKKLIEQLNIFELNK